MEIQEAGGLLIICSQSFENNGTVQSNGSNGGDNGGSSGGGSINIFYHSSYLNTGSIIANGGSSAKGGRGGNGCITIGTFDKEGGTFVKNI